MTEEMRAGLLYRIRRAVRVLGGPAATAERVGLTLERLLMVVDEDRPRPPDGAMLDLAFRLERLRQIVPASSKTSPALPPPQELKEVPAATDDESDAFARQQLATLLALTDRGWRARGRGEA